ncbi:hypothetical protein V6N12_029895 [Hibiscus sabdariffa]|uniref:Uncharacterized protein n=1 Tax=Hibiscus sabdariffa TaxID=183260 RepID=A0ABR2CXH0_9ROSI
MEPPTLSTQQPPASVVEQPSILPNQQPMVASDIEPAMVSSSQPSTSVVPGNLYTPMGGLSDQSKSATPKAERAGSADAVEALSGPMGASV